MKKRIAWGFLTGFLFFFTLLAYPAVAAIPVSISATVDKTHLTLDDSLKLNVRINGTTEGGTPALPPLPDFDLQSAGTSSSIQIINGSKSASVTHRYVLLPKKEGTFTIGAVTMDLDGKHYESPPITVTVVPPTTTLPDKDAPIFGEAEVSNTTPYLQEQVALTYRLYRKVEIRNATLEAPLEHFRRVELGQPVETTRVINGVRYYVSEARYAIFPMQEGVLKIPSAIFQLDLVKRDGKGQSPFGRFHFPDPFFNDPFFSGGATLERKKIRTREIAITVRPFPTKGKPENFNPLTGPLTLESEINPKELKAGETATWTVTLKGWANMNEVKLAPPAANGDFKVYADQPVTEETAAGGNLAGTKTFKYAIVPTGQGSINIEEIQLPYFDPEKKEYRVLTTGPLKLEVLPGGNEQTEVSKEKAGPSGASSKKAGGGLLPIHTQPEILDDGRSLIRHPGFWIPALLLPPFGFLAYRNFFIKRQRIKQDTAFARRQQAATKALERLENIQNASGLEGQALAREISLIVREYLGDRFDFQGTALTPTEVGGRLDTLQLDPAKIKTVQELLEHCQEMEYAPVSGGNGNDLVAESTRLIRDLEEA